jgi:hypothetical protein
MGFGVVFEPPQLVLVDRAEHPRGEQTIQDPLEPTLVDDRVEFHVGAVDGLLNRERRFDSRTSLDKLVSWHRLAHRCANRTSATANGHHEAVFRTGTDATASDLELLERGRQKAAWAVVLTVVRETVVDHQRRSIDAPLCPEPCLHCFLPCKRETGAGWAESMTRRPSRRAVSQRSVRNSTATVGEPATLSRWGSRSRVALELMR